MIFHSISKFYFYTLGALLLATSHASAEIKDWTLAFTGLDSDFDTILLDYKIGTGRSSFDVNLLTKRCVEPVTDITVGISNSTSEAVGEVQDLEVSLNLEDKSNLVGSQIWNNDTKSVEMCVRVDLLSESNVVIKRNERDIEFNIDYRVDFTFDNVTFAQSQLIPQDDAVVQLVADVNITMTGGDTIVEGGTEVRALTTVEDDSDATLGIIIGAFQAATENILQEAGIDAKVEVTASGDYQTEDLDINVKITFLAYCDGTDSCIIKVQEYFETYETAFTQSIDDGSFETSYKEIAAAEGFEFSSTSISGIAVSEPEPEFLEFIQLIELTATVGNYIEACTCYGANNFNCNTNLLGPNDYLNVCMKSVNAEMEIDGLGNVTVTQDGSEFAIVKDGDLRDSSISSKTKVTSENGMHVASVIPADFFSYDRNNIAKVSGVVYLKLVNSRRRLAVELIEDFDVLGAAGSGSTRALAAPLGDTETAFAISVVLAKNEVETLLLDDDGANAIASSSTSTPTKVNVMMTGIIVASAASAVAIMIFFFVKKSGGLAKNSSFV